jgi:dihydrofolate reductase
MRRIINSTYMSLDGVVQKPELWTFDYRDDAAAKFGHDQLFNSDAVLMGRRTYEIFAEVWPSATDAEGMADRMNSLPKYVVSDSLTQPQWNNTTVINRAEFPARARDLKQQPGQDIIQYGYGPVTAALLRGGLLDELRIWLHPLLVGSHAPDDLLAGVGADARFRLADLKAYDSGMVILSYQPQPGA